MSQAESRLSRKIMEAIRVEGYFCFKIHGGPTMMAGLPDIIACVDGLFIGLETKMPSSRTNVSPKQAYVHDRIRDAKGYASIVCSPREALDFIHACIASHSILEE